MYESYEKHLITFCEFNSLETKNTSMSEGSIGVLMFDRYLMDNGWLVHKGALRNAYHPDAVFFNPQTGESILTQFGVRLLGRTYTFTIFRANTFYQIPTDKEGIAMFENGMLSKII